MALQDGRTWEQFFVDAEIPRKEAKTYAKLFNEQRISESTIKDLTKEYLQELGITVLGDILLILQQCKIKATVEPSPPVATIKAPSAKLPSLTSDMTKPQFRKFLIDWTVFKQITGLVDKQTLAQLYNCCDESVQNSIVNIIPDIFSVSEEKLIKELELIVTKQANPTVHRMTFSSIIQTSDESIQEYVIKLRSSAPDCEFTCPSCNFDISEEHIKDQFIRGLHSETMKTDILAKASQLKSLGDVIKHAEALETATRDQQALQQSEVMSARRSRYKRDNKGTIHNKRPCSGCGAFDHGQKGANDRPTHCPAWGNVCHNCNIPNHFIRVCRQPKKPKDDARAISVAQAIDDRINVSISPSLPRLQQHPPANCKVFPDSGASICLAGTVHLRELNLEKKQLIPCFKQITVVGGSTLNCFGWLPMTFSINNHTSRQALFFCEEADRIYLSRKACIDLSILPPSYPHPMYTNDEAVHSIESVVIPEKPKSLPYPATEDNINDLKQHLIDTFKETAFSKSTPFPSMDTKPVHIHVDPEAKPHAHHVPIPVPFHWKEQVKQDLDNDIAREIIEPVPIGSPVDWCSKMIVTAKKMDPHAESLIFKSLITNAHEKPIIVHLHLPLHLKYLQGHGKLSSMQSMDITQYPLMKNLVHSPHLSPNGVASDTVAYHKVLSLQVMHIPGDSMKFLVIFHVKQK